jgi:Ca2+-binding RTX toxin-like protein
MFVPLALPATAHAAVAQRMSSGELDVAGGSERNTVTIALVNGSFVVKDEAGMDDGAGCSPVDANTTSCPAAPVRYITVELGAGNDKFSATARQTMQVDGQGGADDITGGPFGDNLTGGAGNDTVAGGDGGDDVTGGSGDDSVDGGASNDGVAGGPGNDTVNGGDGNDGIYPDAGPSGPTAPDDDVLAGGDGIDQAVYIDRTTSVAVSIDGVANDGARGEHDDVRPDVEEVSGGLADDDLRGSPADESFYGRWGDDHIDGGGGSDRVDGEDGNDTVNGGAGFDDVRGGPGNDKLDGSVPGLVGVDEGDVLFGGPGADEIAGGDGVDAVSYAEARGPVVVTFDGQPGDGPPGEGDNLQPDVEHVISGAGDDTLTGARADNIIETGDGEDYADGGRGHDKIATGDAFDVVRARDGIADAVNCGGSNDFAIVDVHDAVAASCETVDRGARHPRAQQLVLVRPRGRGESFFGLSGMHRTVPLRDEIGVPLEGTTLDASAGAIALAAARGSGGRQTGTFSRGAFLVGQVPVHTGPTLTTELELTGGDELSQCASPGSHAVLRRLTGDARGRFRIRGRFSSATVGHARWTVTDRCDGTLTSVRSGRVRVRDQVAHRTVRLTSGQRYLARRGAG